MYYTRMRWVWAACACWCSVAVAAATEPVAVAAWRRALASAAGVAFSVESTVQLNSAERSDREIGYRIEADLTLHPVSLPPLAGQGEGEGDLLLRFQLWEARLMLRGAHRSAEWERRDSVWDSHGDRAWFARLRRGTVRHVLLDPADPPDVQGYKKSLVSLFQIVPWGDGGEGGNETDVSGECEVTYETLSDSAFRKIKRRCGADGAAGAAARRVARYEADAAGAPLRLYAEELVTLHDALKARSWHALARRPAPPRAPPAPGADALAALTEEPLTLRHVEPEDEDARLDVQEAINVHRAALEGEAAGAGGAALEARAALRLLPALRAAASRALLAALRAARNRDVLLPLCRALGVAGSAAAVRAARDFLHMAARDPLEPLAHAFLAGFALAPDAQEEAVSDVLKLGEEARRAAVGESALLAAAGAARSEQARTAVRDALLRQLARCAEDECRAVRLAALGNMRADAAEALVAHAESDGPRAALAALRSLRAAPASALSARHLARVGLVASNASLPLEVRAAALEEVVTRRAASRSGAVPLQLLELARALHAERSRAAHELRRVLWQRVDSLRDAPPIRALLPLLPPELRTWDARAHAGTSTVMRRETGWGGGAAGGWRALLDSVQVAAGGLLRRGVVALLPVTPDGTLAPELEVEVWTRGLEAVAGSAEGEAEAEAGGEAEGVAGGLGLSVGGVRMRDVMLFDGQAELLGHIWSGTGSAPTSVVRALRVVRDRSASLPLLCGCALQTRARAAAALALDAHAAVSLWHRTARGALRLRVAALAEARAAVRTAWGELRAARRAHAEPRLRIAFELDFYDGVALCVRAASPNHTLQTSLEMESVQGARRMRVRRGQSQQRAAAGRTLALGRTNDAACRTLRAADGDGDGDGEGE